MPVAYGLLLQSSTTVAQPPGTLETGDSKVYRVIGFRIQGLCKDNGSGFLPKALRIGPHKPKS